MVPGPDASVCVERAPRSEGRAPLLPPELPWLYVVIPLPAAYLMGHDLL